MLVIAGGIILALIVLAFLPELIEIALTLIGFAVAIAIVAAAFFFISESFGEIEPYLPLGLASLCALWVFSVYRKYGPRAVIRWLTPARSESSKVEKLAFIKEEVERRRAARVQEAENAKELNLEKNRVAVRSELQKINDLIRSYSENVGVNFELKTDDHFLEVRNEFRDWFCKIEVNHGNFGEESFIVNRFPFLLSDGHRQIEVYGASGAWSQLRPILRSAAAEIVRSNRAPIGRA